MSFSTGTSLEACMASSESVSVCDFGEASTSILGEISSVDSRMADSVTALTGSALDSTELSKTKL